MKLLLAVDGSNFTKKMLAYLTTHDELFTAGNDYTVLTVQPPLPPRVRSTVGNTVVEEYSAEQAEKVLAPVTEFLLRHGIDAKSSWKVGLAGETIAEVAKAGNFDLVVLGSHGHGALLNLVMGSVTTEVLAKCGVPLLIIR